MDTTKLLGLQVAGSTDRARISEVTGNFNLLDQYAESWNGFSNTGTVEVQGTDFTIKPLLKIATELFSLTVKMPRAFAEDDTITVDDVVYNLYQGSDPALSEAWKAGEVVTINFDKVSRRCWASAGGGAPRPLPPQVSNMQASTPEGETPTIVFTWTNPVDDNFAGMVLIVKEGSAPNGIADGTQVYKGTGTTFTYTEGVQFERTYYGRGFAYNSQNKFQMDATGAIASATPSDTPDAVTGVTLQENKSSATLTWTNPTQQSFQTVKVIQKIGSSPENPDDGTVVYSGTGTTVTVNDLQDSVNYYFAIFAIGKNGKYRTPIVKEYTPKIYPQYSFTGNHQLFKDDNSHWRVKFTSSGVLENLGKDLVVDIFLVGGGAGGNTEVYPYRGGGGGYTKTIKKYTIKKGQRIQVIIGAGGPGFLETSDGGVTSFASLSVNGGHNADGGSGGGGGADCSTSPPEDFVNVSQGGKGGSDGGNGADGVATGSYESNEVTKGGKGQGTTTREFGEAGAELYSGGGGGEGRSSGVRVNGVPGLGGDGTPILAKPGPNSGGFNTSNNGRAGGGYGGGGGAVSGTGAQGIVIIRDARVAAE